MKLQPSRRIEHPRWVTTTSPLSSNRVERNGETLINFAGNDYLGLANDDRVQVAAIDAVREFGCGATASPLIIGHHPLHERCCKQIADLKQVESALLFPCGFSANVGTIEALCGPEDLICADRLVHASMIDGCRMSAATVRFFGHNNLKQLERRLETQEGNKFVVSEGIFSMDGTMSDVDELLRLCATYQATLILDEAHSNGVIGDQGQGLLIGSDAESEVAVLHVGTLSKAFGSQGGFVAGTQELLDRVVNLARPFMFSTGLAPAAVGAASAAIELSRHEHERRLRLRAISQQMRAGLAKQGWQLLGALESPILPIVLANAELAVAASEFLARRGFLVPAIRPPTVKPGTSRLRLSLSATLLDDDVESLLLAFQELSKGNP